MNAKDYSVVEQRLRDMVATAEANLKWFRANVRREVEVAGPRVVSVTCPLEKCSDVSLLRAMCGGLWYLLDDIIGLNDKGKPSWEPDLRRFRDSAVRLASQRLEYMVPSGDSLKIDLEAFMEVPDDD